MKLKYAFKYFFPQVQEFTSSSDEAIEIQIREHIFPCQKHPLLLLEVWQKVFLCCGHPRCLDWGHGNKYQGVSFQLLSHWFVSCAFNMWCSWQKHMRCLIWSPGCITAAQDTATWLGKNVCELFSPSPAATGICACVLSCCRTLLTVEHLSSCVQNNPKLKWENSLSSLSPKQAAEFLLKTWK